MKYTLKLVFGGDVVASNIETEREPQPDDLVTLPDHPRVIYQVRRVLHEVGEDHVSRLVAYAIERMP